MSAVARGRMRMRARIVRNRVLGTDEYGGPLKAPKASQSTEAEPCFAWNASDARQIFDEQKDVVLGAVRVAMPTTADVVEGDTIAEIVDRLGGVLFPGPLKVTAVMRTAGHLAVMARVQRRSR